LITVDGETHGASFGGFLKRIGGMDVNYICHELFIFLFKVGILDAVLVSVFL